MIAAAAGLAGGGLLALSPGAAQTPAPRNGPAIDPRAHGVTFDGVTDDTAAWQVAATAADRAGLPIVCPAGTSLITGTVDLPERTMLFGAGRERTILLIRNGAPHPTLYALRCRSGLVVSNLGFAIVAEAGPGKWAAGLGFADAATGIRFERLAFDGGAGVPGAFTGYIDNVDVGDVRFSDCTFRNLEIAGVVKGNGDTSSQRDWQWLGCRGAGCIDGINVNSPHGSWTSGRIIDCAFSNTRQFPFALAGPDCSGWVLDVSGSDNDYELVHLEDGANAIRATIRDPMRCNRKPGMLGSPGTANGIVTMLGGCRDVEIDITATLDDSTPKRTAAVVVQAGGPRVSGAAPAAPADIVIGGRVSLGASGAAVIAFDARLRFDDLRVDVRPGARRSQAIYSLSGCEWSGTATVRDPGPLLSIDANNASTGAWDRLRVEFDRAQSGFEWLSGVFPEQRNATPIARSIVIVMPRPAGDALWATMCPAPYAFEGTVSVKRTGAVQSYALGRLSIRGGMIARLDAEAVVRRSNAPGGVAGDGAAELRIAGRMLQLRSRSSGAAGSGPAPAETIALTLEGAFFPAIA